MLFEVFDVDLLDTMSAALYYLAVIYTVSGGSYCP